MKKIRILTSQNVAIEYMPAQVGERVISNLIDLVIKAGYAIFISLVLNFLEINYTALSTLVIWLPLMLYNPFCEIYLNGQSIGMRVRKTKVVSLDGKELTVGSVLLRSLLRVVDVSVSGGAVALFSIAVTEKAQRLGDIAAGTTVVKIGEEVSFSDIQFNEFDPEFKVTYEQVKQLKDHEVALIKEALSTYSKTKNKELLEITSRKVKEKLDVDSTFSAPKFLRTIVKDYDFLTGKM